jgi:hypothetical protein
VAVFRQHVDPCEHEAPVGEQLVTLLGASSGDDPSAPASAGAADELLQAARGPTARVATSTTCAKDSRDAVFCHHAVGRLIPPFEGFLFGGWPDGKTADGRQAIPNHLPRVRRALVRWRSPIAQVRSSKRALAGVAALAARTVTEK